MMLKHEAVAKTLKPVPVPVPVHAYVSVLGPGPPPSPEPAPTNAPVPEPADAYTLIYYPCILALWNILYYLTSSIISTV